ncbi:MAG: flagellar basal body P-ring protein FlgI [Pseudomonadota bacterium]
MGRMLASIAALMVALLVPMIECAAQAQQVPVRSLGRFDGWRDNALVGYGLVTGLAGTGDTRRNAVTRQALRNVLSRLGTNVTEDEISSRNVAVVIVMAQLPASANIGDRLDVTVSSIGDARSLAGGTLLMTPLIGPDQHTYALAQGSLLVGGFQFEANQNLQQRNHPTTARLQGGATVETEVDSNIVNGAGELSFLLSEPNFGTAQDIAEQIQGRFGHGAAVVRNADEVRIYFTGAPGDLAPFIAAIEAMTIVPILTPRIVINERTGTVVAGGGVMISSVVISQGDIRITVETRNDASQPMFISGLASDISSLVVTNTRLNVDQGSADATVRFGSTSIADLVQGLARLNVDTRRIISILQAVKAAGALHAEIIVQ